MTLLLFPFLALAVLLIGAVVMPLQLILRAAEAARRVWYAWRRRAQEPDEYPPLDEAALRASDTLVVVLHGTAARNAPWTRPGSAMHRAVMGQMEAAGQACAWYRLGWTGENTVADRLVAIRALCVLLHQVFEAQPTRNVVLLGHSHGGSIAFKAAETFAHAPGLRVATLATPFICAQPRLGAIGLAILLPAVNLLVLCIAVGVAVGHFVPASDYDTLWGLLAGVAAAGLAAGRLAKSYADVAADARELYATVPAPAELAALQPKTLVVSRAGDEADGVLKLVSVANGWITRTMNSAGIFSLAKDLALTAHQLPALRASLAEQTALQTAWHARQAKVEADRPRSALEEDMLLLGAEALAQWAELNLAVAPAHAAANPPPANWRLVLRMLGLLWNASKLLLVLELLSMWTGLLVLAALQRGVGTRTATVAARVTLSSSETPPGTWLHLQTLPSRSTQGEFLSHSQIYGDPDVLARVADWIVQRNASEHRPAGAP
jgi:hypothetical protein